MITLKGYEAIEYAESNGLLLSKYADPVEDAREGLTPVEATKIASEDPSLIYAVVLEHPVRCTACGNTVESDTATRHEGYVYCAACLAADAELAAAVGE